MRARRLVVELLEDLLANFRSERLGVDLGCDPVEQPQKQVEILHVGPDRGVDAGGLDLDRDLAAVAQLGPVDLGSHQVGRVGAGPFGGLHARDAADPRQALVTAGRDVPLVDLPLPMLSAAVGRLSSSQCTA